MVKGVQIDGTVFAENGDLSHDEFLPAFIGFVESKGWSFGGGTVQVDDDGELIEISKRETP